MNLLVSAGLKCPRLHPVFGLDEDWNTSGCTPTIGSGTAVLHPVFGLDEDWNTIEPAQSHRYELHPVFGLDEDWNRIFTILLVISRYCIQSSGWMRIGTQRVVRFAESGTLERQCIHPSINAKS